MLKNEKITNFGVPKMVMFRTFSEKVDFTKIGVSPRREHDFWGPDPSKNSKKSMKKSCYFWTSYFSRFFTNLVRFGVPKWVKNGKKTRDVAPQKRVKNRFDFLTTFWRPQASILGDLGAIWGDFLRIWWLIWGDFQ